MTDKLDGLVEGYLNDVDSQLKGVTRSQRQELLVDLQTHINQLRADEQADSEADVRNILDRLGSPETVAAAARTEAGVPPVDAVNRSRRLKRILVYSAIGLVVVLIAIYVMFFSMTSHKGTAGAAPASVTGAAQPGGHHV